MSDNTSTSTPASTTAPAVALCETCGHDLSGHDRIGLRWCAVTRLDHSDRACLCSRVVASARVLKHY